MGENLCCVYLARVDEGRGVHEDEGQEVHDVRVGEGDAQAVIVLCMF